MIRHKNEVPWSLQVAGYLIIIVIFFVFMYVARPILVPLSFGILFAMLLYPLCRLLENNGFPRILAIAVTLIIVVLTISGLVTLLSTQIYSFVEDLPDIAERVDAIVDDIEWYLFKNFNIQVDAGDSFVQNSLAKFLDSGSILLAGTISTFSVVFNFIGLVPVYIFLFLLYRSSFRDFLMYISPVERHRAIRRIIEQVQKVVQNYIIGMFTVMGLVGVLNSIALFIIGVDYAIFFGFFAALLMIIPYIGVLIGSLLPAFFALVTKDSTFYPLAVIASFSLIQFLEGNFITPKITGSKVQINALAAIIGLVVGGYLWGTAGLIIFMPFVAILKVLFDNIEPLKPYGMLLGTEIYSDDDKSSKLSEFSPARNLNIAPSRRKREME
ncbi:MAG: AI-2E family transporter [Bacteroidia bacterium]